MRHTTACWAPRPAPNHISARPIVLAPLSTCRGRSVPARSRRSRGTASQPYVWPASAVRESGNAGDAPPPALTGAALDEADHHDDEQDHSGHDDEARDGQLPVRPLVVDVRAD